LRANARHPHDCNTKHLLVDQSSIMATYRRVTDCVHFTSRETRLYRSIYSKMPASQTVAQAMTMIVLDRIIKNNANGAVLLFR
jgi:hypothetical protein